VFIDFLYALREEGVRVGTHEWLAFLRALGMDLHGTSLEGFYEVGRCLLVASERDYDGFDRAFLRSFAGAAATSAEILEDLARLFQNPQRLAWLDPALRAALEGLDPDELRRRFFERLAEQRERHAGGNKWIGSGGTSPFGQGGFHPTGVRIGGAGGGRSALAVADERRFREYRRDRILDTRLLAAALRRLRRMARDGDDEELDLERTVDETAKAAGELEVVMRPPRRNDVRVLLLLDVGGSMDPHTEAVERLFSAAAHGGGFREVKHYYFHNCPYSRVWEDAAFTRAVSTPELLRSLEPTWRLVCVGDAYMHPGELSLPSGNFWEWNDGPTGLTWLARLADRFPRSAWLNPEPRRIWSAPTIAEIGRLFPMFELTLDGLTDMVDTLRRPPSLGFRERARAVFSAASRRTSA
jgi:hypothetical protein